MTLLYRKSRNRRWNSRRPAYCARCFRYHLACGNSSASSRRSTSHRNRKSRRHLSSVGTRANYRRPSCRSCSSLSPHAHIRPLQYTLSWRKSFAHEGPTTGWVWRHTGNTTLKIAATVFHRPFRYLYSFVRPAICGVCTVTHLVRLTRAATSHQMWFA